MAEVAAANQHGSNSDVLSSLPSHGEPTITMVPNPDFAFPARFEPRSRHRQAATESSNRLDSASMHIDIPRSGVSNTHRRTVSTLPSFSFNATDASGRQGDDSPPRTSDEISPATPGRRGHRRGGSEFVGGDSRMGVHNALSSSPTKASALPDLGATGPSTVPGRRGHAHRRSAAISSNDVAKLMQAPTDLQPRLSSSLPSTPLEHPADRMLPPSDVVNPATGMSDPFGSPAEHAVVELSARPRVVGFATEVEYIPRPLSTISSETESSFSTIRDHSVNNSISSILSLGASSPPSARMARFPSPTKTQDLASPSDEDFIKTRKSTENEGLWLKRRSTDSIERPASESAMMQRRTTLSDIAPKHRTRTRRNSLGHALGLDRRRSEPTMGISANEASRLSATSLQEQNLQHSEVEEDEVAESKFSARKFKEWATSKITKKSRDASRMGTAASNVNPARPLSAGSIDTATSTSEPAQDDLETVLGGRPGPVATSCSTMPEPARFETNPTIRGFTPSFRRQDSDEDDNLLDLNAALVPSPIIPGGPLPYRYTFHSARPTREFTGLDANFHRRAGSAPLLQAFDERLEARRESSSRGEVFEDEDSSEPEVQLIPTVPSCQSNSSLTRAQDFDATIVNAMYMKPSSRLDTESNVSQRPRSPYGSTAASGSYSLSDGHGSSIMEETIMEEGDEVEIVESHEEPRTSSHTKDSDSSGASTIFAPSMGTLTVPHGQQSLMTPDTYHTSTFPSPALRQGSFDTNRLDTSASSIADNRTISSCATGDHSHDLRPSVDVPSLTSSRSTMISSVPGNYSRRDFHQSDLRSMSVTEETLHSAAVVDRRRKRSSIQSLSQLVGSPFATKHKGAETQSQASIASQTPRAPRKEHRLKRLMFWRTKTVQLELTCRFQPCQHTVSLLRRSQLHPSLLDALDHIVSMEVKSRHTFLTISILALLNAHCVFIGCRCRAFTQFHDSFGGRHATRWLEG